MQYPADLPGAARARIERALVDAEHAFVAADAIGPQPFFPHASADHYRQPPPGADPVHVVLVCFQIAAQALCEEARMHHWSADRLRAAADVMREQITGHVYARRVASIGTRDGFTDAIYRAMGTGGFWLDLQETLRDLAVVVAQIEPRRDDDEGRVALTARRATLLADYKLATGVKASKPIYECRKSGIHKPQFYEWLRGELPSTSQVTVNFERFLAEKRPPSQTD